MTLVYNHNSPKIGAVGRAWKEKDDSIILNDINGRGKLIFLDTESKSKLYQYGNYRMEGFVELINNGMFYVFIPHAIEFIDETDKSKEYSYGGKVRLFFSDNTSKLYEAKNLDEALSLTDKAHLFDFCQYE